MTYSYLQTLSYGTRIVRNDRIRGTYVKGSTLTADLIAMDNGERITDLSDLADYRTLDAATDGFFIKPPVIDIKAMCQWWTMQSEQFRKSVVADVSGSMSYGLTVSWSLMPERAKALVIAAYEEHLAFVATLEAGKNPFEEI